MSETLSVFVSDDAQSPMLGDVERFSNPNLSVYAHATAADRLTDAGVILGDLTDIIGPLPSDPRLLPEPVILELVTDQAQRIDETITAANLTPIDVICAPLVTEPVERGSISNIFQRVALIDTAIRAGRIPLVQSEQIAEFLDLVADGQTTKSELHRRYKAESTTLLASFTIELAT